jgi:flagellar motor switch/type III secretory pathway protein FliN
MISQPITHHQWLTGYSGERSASVSAVLRKKIDAGAGVPPSILQLQAFWDQLEAETSDWARKVYDIESELDLADRRVVGGTQALEALQGKIAFFFNEDGSPGISAIAVDPSGATRNAAQRLGQDSASLTDASPLFLKLLFEQVVTDFGNQIASNVLKSYDFYLSLASDASGAKGRFEAASRYLLAEFRVPLEDQESRICFVFPLQFILDYAQSYLRSMSDQKVMARHQSRKTLSDSVRASTIVLDVVLDRISLTIGECSQLDIGSVLPLAGADGNRLCLTADTINGSVDIGTGELGVWKRQRALKLSAPISESFAQELADL